MDNSKQPKLNKFRLCKQCGLNPISRRNKAYCSSRCSALANPRPIKNLFLVECKVCKARFKCWRYEASKRKYCSFTCRDRDEAFIKQIISSKLQQANPQWKGGITPINERIRSSSEYAQWRTNVFKRDNFTCHDCGKRGSQLEAHHIKSFAAYPHLRFHRTNGQTLCKACHVKTPNYGGGVRAHAA